jgi:hypothetical protein
MKSKTTLTLGAAVALAAVVAGTLPAVADGGFWNMMGDHGQREMRHGDDGPGWGRERMGQQGGMFGPAGNPVFQSFDTDGDGRVSVTEAEAGVQALLATHDADQSGALSEEEFGNLFVEVTRAMATGAFERLDEDGNAEISGAEISFPVQMMTRMGRLTDVNVEPPAAGQPATE